MYAPDLNRIKSPAAHVQYSVTDNDSQIKAMIKNHFFNHNITAIFPDTLHVPTELKEILTVDTEYYMLEKCPLYLFLETIFIDAFINRGEVTFMSIDTYLDTDICSSITPTGFLLISIPRRNFLELGVEKGPAINVLKLKNNKYLIIINLKHPSFKPAKNNYKRAFNLLQQSNITMNLILTWEPLEPKVCPSSIASYFAKKGIKCTECRPSFREERLYNVVVPNFQCKSDELFEWLGLFLLGTTEARSKEESEFLSTYEIPGDSEAVGQVLVMRLFGLLTSTRILKYWDSIRNYISLRSSIPWIGLHIHGFEDSLVSWNLEPHCHSVFGDNYYSIICDKNNSIKTCKVFTTLKNKD